MAGPHCADLWNSSRREFLTRGALFSAAGLSLIGAKGVQATEPKAVAAKDITHSKNIDIVLAFCKAGQMRDLETQMSFITDDSIYHNMPDASSVGRAQIRAMLGAFRARSDATEIIVRNIAETRLGAVMTERLDRSRINGKWIEVPVMGVTEIMNGKIKHWRDYFDNLRLRAQMG
jgi:limonene-1,2-epoxide hydrolase